ncbi:hypothetical protein HPB49_011688 [Dermacentor silvarum]|uniref:Uncharacterized protein n=1 Tax=Dermacentor silvarum TaxID=543639 RepID=A0ACB8CEW8_DERSI|nr:hypothetical protein HPB49_011688 [Dermacentor silvarum]
MREATNESQKTPKDFTEAAKAFRSAVNALRVRHDYTLFKHFKYGPDDGQNGLSGNSTNNVVGENTVRIANTGCARRGFTVALAACASGHKLPAFVILKEPSGRIPPKAFMSLRIPELREGLQTECLGLVFASDSEDSFDGFEAIK